MLHSPIPYFGKKPPPVVAEIWRRFGTVDAFVDPSFGSASVLLGRPLPVRGVEIINDLCGLAVNFWQAVKADPEAVARHARQPNFENCAHARHVWLTNQRSDLVARLEGNPDYFDARIAGWWAAGIARYIGSGFCSGRGPWHVVEGQLVNTGERDGQGIERKRPHLTRPCLISRLDLEQLIALMLTLADRLESVNICCGDWKRVLSRAVLVQEDQARPAAVFIDPPYDAADDRDMRLYASDDGTYAADVRAWAIENGDDPKMRIALCGYEGFEMPSGWSLYRWTAAGGYGSQGEGRGRTNKSREVIWFSRFCVGADLFAGVEEAVA